MQHRGLVACLLFGALAACQADGGTSTTSQAILGGRAPTVGEFPTVVAMVVDQGRRGLCTGTLVHPEWILTAAHCVDPQTLGYSTQQQVTDNVLVVVDSIDLFGSGGTVIEVEATYSHEDFIQPQDPDVGLIKLARPITDRAPTPMNVDPAKAPVGVTVTMVGYGVADDGNAGKAFVLDSKTSVSCSLFGPGTSNSEFLCFDQRDGTGKCSGDSGGPSFAMVDGRQTVVGITSFGDENCELGGADMRVDASLDFLRTHAPEIFCQADGRCDETCGANGLPEDTDCAELCEVDDDCDDPDNEQCLDNECVPRPGSDGGLGSSCESGADCFTGLCAEDDGSSVCTQACEPGADNACPDGFSCTAAGDQNICWAEDGGCSAGGRGAGVGSLLLLGALAFATRRRRPARARR